MTTVIALVVALLLSIVVILLMFAYCYKAKCGCFTSKKSKSLNSTARTSATSYYNYPGTHQNAGVVRQEIIL